MKKIYKRKFIDYKQSFVEEIDANVQKRVNKCLDLLSKLETDTKLSDNELFDIAYQFDKTISSNISEEVVSDYFISVFINVIRRLKKEEEYYKLVNIKNYCDAHIDTASLAGLDLFSYE
jgi:hypothetical protein